MRKTSVYSLGVLLYELLTGTTPFDRDQFKDAGLDEVRRLIREQEPPRPSTRISTMGMAASTVSEHRKTDPVELSNSLRHELDWIVMKAMEKDRARRYETAKDFARDIQRYLHDEAVEACPPSTVYRLRKFTRRHQAAVIATTAVSLALILGAGVAAGQAYRATKAEKYAEEQLQIAQDQERLAKQQTLLAKKQKKLAEESAQRERDLRTEAEAARKQSEAVTSFLVDIFRSPDPERDGRTITVAEMLDKAKTRVETEFKEDKSLQAKLLRAIWETYQGLGLVQETTELAKQSYDMLRDILGPRHPDTLAAMQNLASSYAVAGRTSEALTLGEETLQLRRDVLGPTHPDTLESMNNLATFYEISGRSQEAIALLEKALPIMKTTLGLDHPTTLSAMGNLAPAYGEAGQSDKVLALTEEVLRVSKEKFGFKHPTTLWAMHNLAAEYWHMNRLDQSILLFEETLALMRTVLGQDHPNTLETMGSLGCNYLSAGQPEKAVPLLEGALQQCKQKLGPAHPTTLLCMNNLVGAYVGVGRFTDGQPLLEECYRLTKESLGPEHPRTLITMNTLATTYWTQRRLDQSISLFEEALKLHKQVYGEDHPDTLLVMANLGVNYKDAGRIAEALPLLEAAYRASSQHPSLRWVGPALLDEYVRAGKSAEAAALVKDLLAPLRQSLSQDSPELAGRLAEFSLALLQVHAFADVELLLRECLTIREKTASDDWRTFNTKSMLGGALLGQAKQLQATDAAAASAKLTEAEPLLVEGYDGMQQREATIPPEGKPRLTEALQRLVDLYTAWGKPEEVAKWQEMLDALQGAAQPESKEN